MRRVTCLALLLPGLAAAQPAPARPPQPEPIIARRGALAVHEAAVREWLEREAPEARDRLRADPQALTLFVRNRLLRLSLLDEARAQRFDQRPEVAQRAEQAARDAVVDAFLGSLARPEPGFPAEAEIQAAYDANRARFLVPRQYQLAQIFLAVPQPATPRAEEDAQKRLREWRQQAMAARNRVEFAELVRRHSEARGATDLGWMAEDRLIPPIREAVAGLEEGGISEPVRSADGWHLLRLTATRPAAPAPLAEVREGIVAALRQQRGQELARLALAEFLRREPVQIDEIQLGRLGADRR